MSSSINHLRLVKSLIPYKGPIDEDDAVLAIELLSRDLSVKSLDHAILYLKKMKELYAEEMLGISIENMDTSTEVVIDDEEEEKENSSTFDGRHIINLADFVAEIKKDMSIECGSVTEDGVTSLYIGDQVYELSKECANIVKHSVSGVSPKTIDSLITYLDDTGTWIAEYIIR